MVLVVLAGALTVALVAVTIKAVVIQAKVKEQRSMLDVIAHVALDDDDIATLKERDANGNLVHKLCVFCGGWHIPALAAPGCPRIKACDINKNQAVTHVEYWPTWDSSTTVFPAQIGAETDDDIAGLADG